MMLLPGNFIYQMSSWTRAIVIPLSIVHSMNPRRPVPAGFDLKELFLPGARFGFPQIANSFTWRNLFLRIDTMLKLWENYGSRACASDAIRNAEKWILERTRYTDGLAAIYPPMMYVIMALDLLGYPPDHPDRVEAQTPVRPPDGRRRRALLLPTLLSRWSGTPPLPLALGRVRRPLSCAAQMRGLAADEGSSA